LRGKQSCLPSQTEKIGSFFNFKTASLAVLADTYPRWLALASQHLPTFRQFSRKVTAIFNTALAAYRSGHFARPASLPIETIHFGNGSEGDAKRLELAIASNIGASLGKEDRKNIAELASQHGYTQEFIDVR
jgi:hypothetical protein